MRPARAFLALAAALAAVPAAAQPVTSPGPDTVSVTIYGDPHGYGRELELDDLRGYALITETRTVTIPEGRAVIRFEGVAGGILPESAVIKGLPDGVREKNLDAALLSPRSLYAGMLGRPVTIRRVVDGRTIEERAIVRSGTEGPAILQTRDGFVAADCGGGRESIVYDSVPPGLSAKPTLSVETDSKRAGKVALQLSYLAWGFDWQANYVATMREDGRTADLFAWITLASGDVTSFADAETMVVAGRVEREGDPSDIDGRWDEEAPLRLRCFFRPMGPASTMLVDEAPALPEPPGYYASLEMSVSIKRNSASVVDAIMAEDLAIGDLRAYRVPHRTTVAAMSQKQVGLLDRKSVAVEVVHASPVYFSDGPDEDGRPRRVKASLHTTNSKAKGLGLALPRGNVKIFEPYGEMPLLSGESSLWDTAEGQELWIGVTDETPVRAQLKLVASGKGWRDFAYTVSNPTPHPIYFEGFLINDDNADEDQFRLSRPSARLARRNGRDYWPAQVPAGSEAVLRFRLTSLAKKKAEK